jgi:hypothetical protein
MSEIEGCMCRAFERVFIDCWMPWIFATGCRQTLLKLLIILVHKSEWGSGGRWFKSSRA